MAFALLQSDGEADTTFTFPNPLASASLVVIAVRWEGATGVNNATISQSGGGAFTMLTRVDTSGGDNHGQIGYRFLTGGLNIFDITWPASAVFIEAIGAEFSYTDTPTFDTSNTGSGSGTSLASGSISLDASAADWLAVGYGTSYSSVQTYSNRNINGVAAAGSQDGAEHGNAPYATLFWRLLSTTGFTGGTATCTCTVSDAWICNVAAFKSGTAAGPISNQPETLHVIRSGTRLR
jgi:hypothetical protein